MNRCGYTLAELLVVIVLVAVLGLFLATCSRRTCGGSKFTHCQNNLAQLWKMQHNYSAQYGGPAKLMPPETGPSFWLKLSEPPTALIDSTLLEIYGCPLSGSDEWCDYRGPRINVNAYRDEHVVGADIAGNHGRDAKHNVLLRSGAVRGAGGDEALWKQAELTTSDGRRP